MLLKINHIIGLVLNWCIGLITGGIVIVLFAGVILRYVFSAPLFWTEEIVVLGLIWITFLSGIILVRDDKNVVITVVTDALPARISRVVVLTSNILVLLMIAIMLWLSWILTGKLGMSTTPAIRLSESWFGAALVVGFGGMLFFQIQRVVTEIRSLFDPESNLNQQGEESR